MISKEEFIKTMNFIKERNQKQDKFINILEELSKDTYCDCFLYADYEDKMIELLENMFEDRMHDISYFCYDCDWLYDNFNEDKCPKIDDKYLYTSLETLYDYLISEMKHD